MLCIIPKIVLMRHKHCSCPVQWSLARRWVSRIVGEGRQRGEALASGVPLGQQATFPITAGFQYLQIGVCVYIYIYVFCSHLFLIPYIQPPSISQFRTFHTLEWLRLSSMLQPPFKIGVIFLLWNQKGGDTPWTEVTPVSGLVEKRGGACRCYT